MRKLVLLPVMVIALWGDACSVHAEILWSNGDGYGGDNLQNRVNSEGQGARVFDDFLVDAPTGWNVSEIWSNNILAKDFFGNTPSVTMASWSIRSDVTVGNAGTIVAEGISSATKTSTGRSPNFLYEEFRITVAGLSIHLDPGTYWLQVTPVVGEAFNSVTNGENSVGSPAGNNGNAFWDRPSSNDILVARSENFSMGIAGSAAVPEPSTFVLWSLLACVAVVVGRWRRNRATAAAGCV